MIRSVAPRAGLVLLAMLAGLLVALAASPMMMVGSLMAAALAGLAAVASMGSRAPALIPVRIRDRRR